MIIKIKLVSLTRKIKLKSNLVYTAMTLISLLIRFPQFLDHLGEAHRYRQSQTVFPIKVWLSDGFSPFHPKVPILGLPEEMYLELPIVQWLGFGLAKMLFISPEISLRLVSLSCLAIVGLLLFKLIEKSFNLVVATASLGIFYFNPFSLWWFSVGMIDQVATTIGFVSAFILIHKNKYSKFDWFAIGLSLTLSFAIKPTTGFIYIIFCILFLFQNKQINRNRIIFILFTTTSYFIWFLVTRSRIPAGVDSSYYSIEQFKTWYFAEPIQYFFVFLNVGDVISRFISTSFGLTLISISLIFLIICREHRVLLNSAALSVITNLSLFLFLNMQHEYYQIAILPLTALLVSMGLGCLYSMLKKINPKINSFVYICTTLFLMVVSTFRVDISRTYIQELMTRTTLPIEVEEIKNFSIDNEKIIITGWLNDPYLMYMANRKGFQTEINSSGNFFEQKDINKYCTLFDFGRRMINTEAPSKAALEIIEEYPDVKEISRDVYDLCI